MTLFDGRLATANVLQLDEHLVCVAHSCKHVSEAVTNCRLVRSDPRRRHRSRRGGVRRKSIEPRLALRRRETSTAPFRFTRQRNESGSRSVLAMMGTPRVFRVYERPAACTTFSNLQSRHRGHRDAARDDESAARGAGSIRRQRRTASDPDERGRHSAAESEHSATNGRPRLAWTSTPSGGQLVAHAVGVDAPTE